MIAIDFLESSASETLLVVVLENWVEFVSRYLGTDMIDWRSTGDAERVHRKKKAGYPMRFSGFLATIMSV